MFGSVLDPDGVSGTSLVQGVAPGLVALHHPQHLHVLREEAGGQQAVDPQLLSLLQGEGHAL